MADWTLEQVYAEGRAVIAARLLYPDDYVVDGYDCRAEVDRIGAPCRVCQERRDTWAKRVAEVRAAVLVSLR